MNASYYIALNDERIDMVLPRINEISSYIAFDSTTSYTNYLGQDMLGSNRSSVYDMALYAEYLYYAYLNDPEIYQDLRLLLQ